MEKTVGIVILNYNAYQETVKCIASIRNKLEELYQIVIVDNGSTNHSYEFLKEYYQRQSAIDVVKNNQNLGFAKGNNIGIRHLREKHHSQFILLLNSDTIMTDRAYIQKMLARYRQGVGVIEANVQNGKGDFTQPGLLQVTVSACFYRWFQIFCRYYDIYFPFKSRGKGKEYLCQVGCAIMLTPDYFKKFQGLYSYTFLYGEEQILLILLDRAGLEVAFAEDTYLIHNEGKSTPYANLQGSRKKDKKAMKGYRQAFIASCMPYKMLVKATSVGSESLW